MPAPLARANNNAMIKLKALTKLLASLSKKEKIVLYVAVFFVLLSFLDRLVVYPIYSKIKSLNDEIKEKKYSIVKSLRILEQEKRISSEVTQYAPFFTKTKSEEEDTTSLLKEVEALANKSSLYIVDMKPGGMREEKDKTKKYIVNLTCEGQMEQLMDFMYNVENSSGLLAIEKYQISPKSRETSVAQCSMTIYKIVIE